MRAHGAVARPLPFVLLRFLVHLVTRFFGIALTFFGSTIDRLVAQPAHAFIFSTCRGENSAKGGTERNTDRTGHHRVLLDELCRLLARILSMIGGAMHGIA